METLARNIAIHTSIY